MLPFHVNPKNEYPIIKVSVPHGIYINSRPLENLLILRASNYLYDSVAGSVESRSQHSIN